MAEEQNDQPSTTDLPRFGTVAFVGRPNAGKSTLLNRILGQKVSIVSSKPQTTRNRIVGILNDARGQIAILDTPGIHKPLHRLNVRMMDHVRSALTEADVIALIVDATEPFGRGDQYVIEMLRAEKEQNPAAKRFVLLNKIDLLKKNKLLPLIQQYHGFGIFDELVPISAGEGEGIDSLVTLLFKAVPPGEPRYPTEDYTTQPERFLAAELIREKVLHHTSDELPYTTAVNVDRFEEDEETGMITIFATVYVERDSQKPIVIGKQANMIKRIGTEARQELESILGTKVFLDLRVAVHQGWREDERFLGELEWPLR
ncbi:MAG TPA: GTPase Era [Thermoanaerobaculia bacterium]|nr:GTPase Era [Thermoanaerobaculia bacterium]